MKGKKFYIALIGLFVIGIGSIFIYRQQEEARALEFEGYEISAIESRVDGLYNTDQTDIQKGIESELAELEEIFNELNQKDLSNRSERQIAEMETKFLQAKDMHVLQEDILDLFQEEEIVRKTTSLDKIEGFQTSLISFEERTVYYNRNDALLTDARVQIETIEEATALVEELMEDDILNEEVDEETLEELEKLINQIKDEDPKQALLEELETVRLALEERAAEEELALEEETEDLLEEIVEEESTEAVHETTPQPEEPNTSPAQNNQNRANNTPSQPSNTNSQSASSSNNQSHRSSGSSSSSGSHSSNQSSNESNNQETEEEPPSQSEQRPAVARKYTERKVVEEIPFETLTYKNANIAAGKEIEYEKGTPGQVVEVYEVTEYTNGTKNKAFVTKEETKPVNRVVTIGTKEPEAAVE